MKYLVICAVLISLIYLNRTYSYFYTKIGSTNLQPTLAHDYLVGSDKRNSQVLNYVALGDSLTSGVGSSNYLETYPYKFAQKLNQKNGNLVSMLVISTPGAKTDNLIQNQLADLDLEQADYITLLIGINDIHDLRSSKDFSQNFETILLTLTKLKAKIIVLNLPYLGPKQSLLFPYQFLFDYQTQQYNNVIQKITQKYNVQLVDLYSATKDFSQNSNFYSQDSFHPSSEGYKSWSQLLNP